MDLSFQNNQTFGLSLNVQAWKPLHPLSLCTFHLQVRTGPGIVPVVYSWTSNPLDNWGNGTITYTDSTGLLYFSAPYSDMLNLVPGIYEFDLELIDGQNVKILTGGAFVITAGITIH